MHDANAVLEVSEGGVDVFYYSVVDHSAVWVVDGAVAADEQFGRRGVGFGLAEVVTERRVRLENVEDSFGRVEAGDLDDVFV